MTKEQPNNRQLAAAGAALLIPVVATARLMEIWLPRPFATAISIFAWMFGVYWIPPRPKMSSWRWLIIVSLISITTFILIVFGIDPFWRK